MDDIRSEVEAKIRTLANYGWSQQKIAEKLEVSQASISRILAGVPVSDGTINKAGSATSDLGHLLESESALLHEDFDRLDAIIQSLSENRVPITVLFFDLVGSTSYRERHGQIKGSAKSYSHNLLVSQCIVRNGGEVVRWLGDGVMGVFCGEVGGRPHPYRALLAGLDAIRSLREHNDNRRHGTPSFSWEEEIHTKVGLSAGQVHFISVGLDEVTSATASLPHTPLTYCDPIGGTVDLAARLQQAATIDVIVIDKDTFFGVGRATDIAPISLTQEQGVQYCELMLQTEWMTTYKPRIAAFSRAEAGIEFLAAAPTGEKADLGTFQKQAQDRARQEGKQIAFVSAPVNCNVAGFAEPVEALAVFLETDAVSSETLAVSLKAREAPVRELAYKSPSSWEIKSLLDNAEKAHRLGIIDESVKLYQQVFQKDHRDFRANIRLAQHYRSIGQVEDARMHWSLAKASDPTQAIAWALAGATYFEGYLLDQSDLADLDRAIVEFGQARQLASEAFDSLLEQHCCAMLALTLLLRNGASDVTRSKELMDEIEKWPSLSQANHVLKGLVEVSFSIAQGTPNEWNQGRERLNGLKAYLEQWGEGRHEQADVAEDNNAVLLSRGRLRILLELATFRLNAAMFLPRRPAATISQEADSSRKSSVSTRLMRDRSR